jgi:hypothetical protein
MRFLWIYFYEMKQNQLLQLVGVSFAELKGSLTRDFRSQFFFMNQCPPGP